MLNLFNLKESHPLKKKNKISTFKSIERTSKHFPSPLREWNNSVFSFNKNSQNKLVSTTNMTNILIKNYFNLYNKHLEVKMRSKKLLMRFRKLTSNRLFINSEGFKHTNNKVYINLYVFNRQKVNQILSLKRWFLKILLSRSSKTNSSMNIIKRINIINKKGINNLVSVSKQKYLLIKTLDILSRENNAFNINNFKDVAVRTENFYKNLIKKSLKKVRMYYYYKQLIYLNRSKLNYTYLQYLTKYLEKIYNKNIEFNIINIKKFYLSSNVLSESIALKLTRNRNKTVKYLNIIKNKINIRSVKKLQQTHSKDTSISNTLLIGIHNSFLHTSNKRLLLQKHIMNNLKYKYLTGFRLEIKGKLAKRASASRSMSKLVYKGNLLDIDSSYKGISSVMLKGNLRSNTQYTKIGSKSRIGSFGIKGWISGN